MESHRFGRPVVVTDHARMRMAERAVTESLRLDLIETGDVRCKDDVRLWICQAVPRT